MIAKYKVNMNIKNVGKVKKKDKVNLDLVSSMELKWIFLNKFSITKDLNKRYKRNSTVTLI